MGKITRYLSPEAEAKLRSQRLAASLSSLAIAVLSIVLAAVILALILLPGLDLSSTTLVAYHSQQEPEQEISKREFSRQVQRQPSAPSSAMAKVIASTVPSPVAVPVPEVHVDPSLDFGNGDDFGDGWGDGDGSGAGGTTFFGQSVRAERIAYVIDFSSSMGSQGRADLMRKELAKSLGEVTHGTKYAIVFFSRIAWVGGDKVNLDVKGGRATVTGEGGRRFEWKDAGGKRGWIPAGIPQRAAWKVASQKALAESREMVKKAPLSSGTSWDKGLEMALDMTPLPQVIYFMTDGVANGSDVWAREIGAKAKSKGVQINCIAMMEPRAHADMDELAKRTGGQFTIVTKDGKHKQVR